MLVQLMLIDREFNRREDGGQDHTHDGKGEGNSAGDTNEKEGGGCAYACHHIICRFALDSPAALCYHRLYTFITALYSLPSAMQAAAMTAGFYLLQVPPWSRGEMT